MNGVLQESSLGKVITSNDVIVNSFELLFFNKTNFFFNKTNLIFIV